MFSKLKAKRAKRNTQDEIAHGDLELSHLNESPIKQREPARVKSCFLFDSYNGILNRHKTNESQDNSLNDLTEKFLTTSLYSNKPQESNFTQQNLPAWKPMLTPKFVINLFLVCSIIFIPIGIILYYTSLNIYEFKKEYTDCSDLNQLNLTCHEQLSRDITYKCKCRLHFTWSRYKDETLFVYYMLENFYQNQRRFHKSRDAEQLLSLRGDTKQLSSDCEPFRYRKDKFNNLVRVAPCGSVANSLFNDTYKIFYFKKLTNESVRLNVTKENLAWNTDYKFKYKNPADFKNTINPPYWSFNVSSLQDAYRNQDLMVWMRSAAFSSFRKLYGRILIKEDNAELIHYSPVVNQSAQNNFSRLPKGHYYVEINYKYPVKQFGGKKYFIIANASWTGGRCFFMAYMYILVGSLCLIVAILLFLLHIYWGHMDYNTVMLLQQYQFEQTKSK